MQILIFTLSEFESWSLSCYLKAKELFLSFALSVCQYIRLWLLSFYVNFNIKFVGKEESNVAVSDIHFVSSLPPPYGFLPFTQKSSYNPYLKFLDFSQHLVAETPMKFFFRKILFTPCDSTFETPSTKIFLSFLL